MLLVADIGGTKVDLALFDPKKMKKFKEAKLFTKNFSSFEKLLKHFLKDERKPLTRAVVGVAGVVVDQKCSMTNTSWKLNSKTLTKSFKCPFTLINDLVASSYAILFLEEEHFFTLNKGEKQQGNRALIIPGTGLGECGMFFDGENFYPFASEGGHVDFAPQNAKETKLFSYLHKKYGHVSYERVLSGPGIVELYRFFSGKEKCSLSSEEIFERALQKRDKIALQVLESFVAILGRECGNLALKMGATGGIYLGGNIVNSFFSKMKKGAFMRSFLDKGRLNSFLKKVPVKAMLVKKTAILGGLIFAILQEKRSILSVTRN